MNAKTAARNVGPLEGETASKKSKIPINLSRRNTLTAPTTKKIMMVSAGCQKPAQLKPTSRTAFGSTIRETKPIKKNSTVVAKKTVPNNLKTCEKSTKRQSTFVRVSADLFEPSKDLDDIFKDKTNLDSRRHTTFLKKNCTGTANSKSDTSEPQERTRLSVYRRNTTCSYNKQVDNNTRPPLKQLTENYKLPVTPIRNGLSLNPNRSSPRRTPRRFTIYGSATKEQRTADIKQLLLTSSNHKQEGKSVKKTVKWQDEITETTEERKSKLTDVIKPTQSKRLSYYSPTYLENVREVEAELFEDEGEFFVGDVSGSPKLHNASINDLCEQLGGGMTMIDQSVTGLGSPKLVSTRPLVQSSHVTFNCTSYTPKVRLTENFSMTCSPVDQLKPFTNLLPRTPVSIEHSIENSPVESSKPALHEELSFLNVLDKLTLNRSNNKSTRTPSTPLLDHCKYENASLNPSRNFIDGAERIEAGGDLISFDSPQLPNSLTEEQKTESLSTPELPEQAIKPSITPTLPEEMAVKGKIVTLHELPTHHISKTLHSTNHLPFTSLQTMPAHQEQKENTAMFCCKGTTMPEKRLEKEMNWMDVDKDVFVKPELSDFLPRTPEKVPKSKTGLTPEHSENLINTPVIKRFGNTYSISSPNTEQKSTLHAKLISPVTLRLSSKFRRTPGQRTASQCSRHRDLLIDDEVAHHMLKISSPSSALRYRRDVMDGLSQLLDEVDEMHFIPIEWELSDPITEHETTDDIDCKTRLNLDTSF